MQTDLPHMLRTDAQNNRDRVLEAAAALFAQGGVDVTMREIARHAEVGPATLYRRFPTKQLLIEEAFAGELQACEAIVHDGCADADPWRGFCSVIQRIGILNARNQGFVEAFMSESPQIDTLAAHRASLLRMLAKLAARAQAQGMLRRDFTIDDLVIILRAGRGLSSTKPAHREAAARRFAELAIDAFRAADSRETVSRPA